MQVRIVSTETEVHVILYWLFLIDVILYDDYSVFFLYDYFAEIGNVMNIFVLNRLFFFDNFFMWQVDARVLEKHW